MGDAALMEPSLFKAEICKDNTSQSILDRFLFVTSLSIKHYFKYKIFCFATSNHPSSLHNSMPLLKLLHCRHQREYIPILALFNAQLLKVYCGLHPLQSLP